MYRNRIAMEDILIIKNFTQFNTLRGYETLHPLANVVDFSVSKPIQNARMHIDTYSVALKESVCGDLKYGAVTIMITRKEHLYSWLLARLSK